ncbi:DUF2243 domain-containing protein [Nocardioides gilvus]|uniref:DUF2243 domain-containing protein n=1 Tax=Nocardioides gilvus TaxID=1735589 RepID=UPI000D74D905|nr:DUF2243 domain-containing protein [Nocardioides gilvus]
MTSHSDRRPGIGHPGTGQPPELRAPELRAPGIVLGIGLGGFVDGIVLHQLLQWHHLLTSTDTDNVGIPYYPDSTVHGLEINTLLDGVFHVFTWLMVLLGMAMLFNRLRTEHPPVWRHGALWAWVLVGWGLFNLVEGAVNHHLLGIHHVRRGEHELLWDLAFLLLGALLVLGGWWWARRTTSHDERAPQEPVA